MSIENPKILLVDDDPAMLRLLARWLVGENFRVQIASDGHEALESIQRDCPHIVVTDWEMPRLNGLELCQKIRQLSLPQYVHILFVTVRTGTQDMIRGLEAGANDFLRKPVDKGEFLARLSAGRRVLELEQRLRLQSKLDPLTGLANQPAMRERLDVEWARSARHHLPLSCAMLDIDFFKTVNDTHGHPAGDEVLRRVARVLSESCRANDVLSRYGGEEFCVLLPETTEPNAVVWADRVRARLAAERIPVGGEHISITASFGVAERLADVESPQQLVDLADQSMLVAKQSGRNRVIGFQQINSSEALRASCDQVGRLFGDTKAGDAMTTIVACLPHDSPIGDAVDFFLRFRLNSAPVVDDQGRLVGILSERDALSMLLWPAWRQSKVAEVMKRHVVTYSEETPVLAIYEFLCRVSMRAVVIVRDGAPVGMLSRGSLLRWFSHRDRAAADARDAASNAATIRQQVLATAQVLSLEAIRLETNLQGDRKNPLPPLIGGASRIEELVHDLLSASQQLSAALTEEHPPLPVVPVLADANSPPPGEIWFPPGCTPELPAAASC